MAVVRGSLTKEQLKKLEYSVHKWSSFSPNYPPSNVLENKPKDQSSRWSSETNSPPQYIILKLSQDAIVHSITFGKYEKTHVCNLKRFKVFGGLEEESMHELLDGGLKNDNKPETFVLRYKVGGKPFACRYIKVMPIQSWGSSFNFTVWYIELTGDSGSNEVKEAVQWLKSYLEKQSVRYCLKMLRKLNYMDSYRTLCKESKVRVEHAALTELFDFVRRGAYEEAEEFMDDAVDNGMLNNYVSKQNYRPSWESLTTEDGPGMRGGHQMCLDSSTLHIYLHGGWNGQHDLSDFWSYFIPTDSWDLLCRDTSLAGGPSARSCHKLCVDAERGQIFVLGRYLDVQGRTPPALKSDFYVYHIESNSWTKLADDTSLMGGPRLIFDHQMCIDQKTSTLYVFGGRILQPTPSAGEILNRIEPIYSGLYSYHIPTNKWKMITSEFDTVIPSRVGHSMLFHPVYRKLYIFAGQRNKEYLTDFCSYHVDTGVVEYLCEGSSKSIPKLPSPGFTQRATLDPELDEIYVLSGLSKDKDKKDDNVSSSFWIFYIQQCKWSCVYQCDNYIPELKKSLSLEPCPRFAHQLIYDDFAKVHYLFGGNPGMQSSPKLRLDDFWKLTLTRPTHHYLKRKVKILIRKYRFHELVLQDTMEAMNYLQSSVSEVADYNDAEEKAELSNLAMLLFNTTPTLNYQQLQKNLLFHRQNLFDELSLFFPENMAQPRRSISDLIPL